MQAPKLNKFFSISVFLHLILFACLIVFFSISHEIKENKIQTIATYIHHSSPSSTINRHSIIQKNIDRKKSDLIKKNISSNKKADSLLHKNNQTSSNADSTQINQEVVQLLHEAIAEKQYYPENALALQQTGKVKIGFMLYPDGHLENVSLLTSSGAASIDAAAIDTVKKSSPIKKAGSYLQKPEFFSIDIIFE